MTFAKKLYLLIAVAVAGLIAVGAVGILQIHTVYNAANYANENSLPSIQQLEGAAEAMFRMRNSVWKHIASKTDEEKAASRREIAQYQQRIADELKNYEQENISDDHDRGLLALDRSGLAAYYTERDAVLGLSDGGDFEGARHRQLSIQAATKQADKALKDHREYNLLLAKQASELAAEARRHALLWSGALGLAVIVGVIVAGVMLARKVVGSLRDAVQLADAVAAGDLTVRVATSSRDEIGQLQSALSGMAGKLASIMTDVQQGAQTIQTAAEEIASGNMDLSSRTEQQAGSLEETASSMEELTHIVQANAQNADQARQLARDAEQIAAHGGAVVGSVVATMTEISAASARIVDIISVIDSIAFQTNILALNAAVEAARAGEQGRGFAVVATEVRSLAHRSSAAAKEIKALIDSAAGQVRQGTELVAGAGTAMERIVSSVQRVSAVVGEISAAGHEQSAGIQQVNQAVTEMDGMTQQNAALVEQSAAAAVSMREQAETLTRLMGHFQLGSHVRPAPAPSPVRAHTGTRLALAYS